MHALLIVTILLCQFFQKNCSLLQYMYNKHHFNQFTSGRINTQFFVGTADRRASKRAFWFVCVLAGSLVNTSPMACYCAGWRVYASFLGVYGGHGSVAPDKRHCQQWTSSLFCGFLPNPFIQDLFLWCTSQEFVISIVFDLSQVCHLFDRALVDIRPLHRSLPTV